MYRCSMCGLLIGAPDETVCDEPSRPCASCVGYLEPIRRTYDADELGIDQEDDD
jgi:hypothetical protein